MKTIATSLFFLFCLQTAYTFQKDQVISITNTSAYRLTDKPVLIRRDALHLPATGSFYAVITSEGKPVPAQLDDLDGDGKWDELFFVIDLPARKTRVLHLQWTKQKPEYALRTSIRFGKRTSATTPVEPRTSDTFLAGHLPKRIGYQPYQTDGPSWENDRVGFRHYFDGRNAKDLFGKRVNWISPENVGLTQAGAVEDNYHVLLDWGRDILPVGNSVGLGGYGLISGDKFQRLGVTVDDTVHNIEKTTLKIACEGPVRSMLNLGYTNWKADNGRTYQVKETPTIWPGMYAYGNSVRVAGLQGDETLFVGLPKVATDHPVSEKRIGNWVVLFTHDKQSYNKEFIIGLAIIVPANAYLGKGEAPKTGQFSNSYYANLKIRNNSPLNYYAVGCWELAEPGFKDAAYFEKYLTYLVGQLDARVTIAIR